MAAVLARLVRLLRLVLCTALFGIRADLVFNEFIKDPQGRALHLRLLGGASVDYFSTEFNELCPEVGAGAIDPPLGMTQRFQHPQRREDPNFGSLQNRSYLDAGQLDNPYAGRIARGNYTEVVVTNAFVPDGDLMALPHNRTQLCHYALRLTNAVRGLNTAVWSRFKQSVAYGFETEFHFRVLHRSRECTVAGQDSPWCAESGADGFAFVIQNDGRQVVGTELNGMGYNLRYSLAIEFDTSRNSALGETSGNHISVQVPPVIGDRNTASHTRAQVAYSDDIPPLQEGTHVVRIDYTTDHYAWDSLGRDFVANLALDTLAQEASARPGVLTVELDGRRVIVVPIDLVNIVKADPTATYKVTPPPRINSSAYDELGNYPGRAWVGFTSSTSYLQHQVVDVLSWTFKEKLACPAEGEGDVRCRINEGLEGRNPKCLSDGSGVCTLVIQNAARQPIKFSALTMYDKPFEATPCELGVLQWNAMHPWFLGCNSKVQFTQDMTELWINTLDGVRSVVVSDAHTLQKDPIPFKRREFFRWCVMEHKSDPFRLAFAQCSCEYCVRLLDLQASYGVFYQHRCSARFGLECPCFEASEVTHDTSQWTVLNPLEFMRVHICRTPRRRIDQ